MTSHGVPYTIDDSPPATSGIEDSVDDSTERAMYTAAALYRLDIDLAQALRVLRTTIADIEFLENTPEVFEQ